MSSRDGRLREVFPVSPCGGLVVAGAGLQAAVQDADQPVGEPPQCVVVFESFGALLVVERAGAGRGVQRRERPGHERVDEPVVVNEPGGDDLLLARGAGDRAGAAVVLAGLRVGVPAGVVAELAEHPGAEDGRQAGLGLVDLRVRVAGRPRCSPRSAARITSVLSLMFRRRARLSAALIWARVSFAARAGSGALPSSSSTSGASRSSNASSAAGKYSRSWCRSRCTARVRSQISVLWVRATTLIAPAAGLSPAAGRSWWESVRTMSASMCASPPSLLAPDTPCRSRYREACSGFTGYTV